MSLYTDFYSDCIRLTSTRTPDGEGGSVTSWVEGERFEAAIVRDTSFLARVAEKSGAEERYTVTTGADVALVFHDTFKRVSDGAIFRVTSAPVMPPARARFTFAQVTAEEWRLP